MSYSLNLIKRTLFVGFILVTCASVQAQTYDFTVPSMVCPGQEASFTAIGTAFTFAWSVNGDSVAAGRDFTYIFPSAGSYKVIMSAYIWTDGDPIENGTTLTYTRQLSQVGGAAKWITVKAAGAAMSITASPNAICDAADLNLSVSDLGSGTYTWTSDQGANATSNTPTMIFTNVTQSALFTIQYFDGIACPSTATQMVSVYKTTVQPHLDPQIYYHKRIINVTSIDPGHYWETSTDGISKAQPVTDQNFTATTEGIYSIRHAAATCWTNPISVPVTFSYQPPLPLIIQVKHLGYNEVLYADPDKTHNLTFANYYWVSDASSSPTVISQYNNGAKIIGSRVFESGTHYLRGQDVGTGTWGPTLTIEIALLDDDYMNWVGTQTFDGTIVNGTESLASSGKSYFDNTGKLLQSQTINLTKGQVLAVQAPINDSYGRPAVSPLPAPTNKNYFHYNSLFVMDNLGDVFDKNDIDILNNLELGSDVPGTVGWYYSSSNTLDTNVPKSKYPYGRTQYYKDGFSGPMYGAGAGEKLKIRSGQEMLTGKFPVTNELDYYLKLRSEVLPTTPTTLAGNAVQTVVRDQNGKYDLNIADKSGKTVLSARNGTPSNNALMVPNCAFASANKNSPNYKEQYDFYILNPQRVSIAPVFSDLNYSVTNLNTGELMDQTTQNGTWPSGFYRVKLISGDMIVAFSNCTFDFGTICNSYIVPASSDETSPNYKQYVDFYIQFPQHVSITQTTSKAPAYKVTNTVSDLELDQTSQNGIWPVGFYRLVPVSGEIKISYSNYFLDVACQFYDDAGRLVRSLSPNGFHSTKNAEVYASNFNDDVSSFSSEGTITLSVANGSLEALGASQWNTALVSLPTIKDHTYEVNFGVDLKNGGQITAFANDNTSNLAQIDITANGLYGYQFVATGIQTKILFVNDAVGPRDFYLNSVTVSDLTVRGIPDATTYTYNHRGWLLSMTEPDAGTTQYMYRKDGSIRYSQNAKQKTANTFSYTSYDQFNRPIESGEYKGAAFVFGSDQLKSSLEFSGQLSFYPDVTSEVNGWVRTHYDDADPNFTTVTGLSSSTFSQNYIRNAVSWTENANNKTWYSYNELGRVTWFAQKPQGLPRTFVVEYQYDFLGNVLQVKQSVFLNDGSANNGALLSTFYHHYEYDADKRLSKAYTSTDGTNKTLHASYQYYLHGPLKRIELGGNLQGIDFVYNIHGWLHSINHPDNSKDPGHDGDASVQTDPGKRFRPDVFGLLLDYYESEFNNLFPVASLDKTKDLQRIHHLPRGTESESLLASSTSLPTSDFLQPAEGIQTDYFKNYSAQSSIYKELVARLANNNAKRDSRSQN